MGNCYGTFFLGEDNHLVVVVKVFQKMIHLNYKKILF